MNALTHCASLLGNSLGEENICAIILDLIVYFVISLTRKKTKSVATTSLYFFTHVFYFSMVISRQMNKTGLLRVQQNSFDKPNVKSMLTK